MAFDGSGTPNWTPDMNFGGVYQVSSDGSGSAAFSFSGNNPGFSQFALYVISANELFFIETKRFLRESNRRCHLLPQLRW